MDSFTWPTSCQRKKKFKRKEKQMWKLEIQIEESNECVINSEETAVVKVLMLRRTLGKI